MKILKYIFIILIICINTAWCDENHINETTNILNQMFFSGSGNTLIDSIIVRGIDPITNDEIDSIILSREGLTGLSRLSKAVRETPIIQDAIRGLQEAERGGGEGERPSMVVDAVAAALVAAGEEVDDDRRKAIHEKVKTKEGRKAALANPAINAQYEAVRAAKAKEKADAAKKSAKAADDDLSAF